MNSKISLAQIKAIIGDEKFYEYFTYEKVIEIYGEKQHLILILENLFLLGII